MLCTKSILTLHSTQLTRLKPQKSTNCHKQELPWTHYCKEAVNVVKHRLEDFTVCAGHLLISFQAQNLITGAEDMDTWCNYLLNSLGICRSLCCPTIT
jgi:hypothetical protein